MGGRSAPFRVGRQPIFDSKLKVHGYELLFRGAGPADSDAMTADVLVHSGLDLGLPSLVGNKPACTCLAHFGTGSRPVDGS